MEVTQQASLKGGEFIIKPTDARARIYDRGLNLVVDTSTLLQKGKGHVARPDLETDASRPRTRNVWTKLTQWLIDGELAVYKEIGSANGAAYLEVQLALEGKSTAVLLLDGTEQIVIRSLVPFGATPRLYFRLKAPSP